MTGEGEEMEEGYKYQDLPRVRSYLIAHPHLYLALEKARVELEDAFPDTPVRLEWFYRQYAPPKVSLLK